LVMGAFAVVAPAVPVHGMDRDYVQNAIVLGALLGPGADTSTVDLDLNRNSRDCRVTAEAAPEMSSGTALIPSRSVWNSNPNLLQPIRQGVQTVFNRIPHNERGAMILSAQGRLPEACTAEGVIRPSRLGLQIRDAPTDSLAAELAGDVWMLHQVDFANQEETAPCFVMLCFFLQDMGDLNRRPIRGRIRRLLPNRAPALSPRSLGSNGDGTPRAGGRRRAHDPNDAGDGDQPMPDANQSNGGGGGWFGRR